MAKCKGLTMKFERIGFQTTISFLLINQKSGGENNIKT